MRSRGEIDRAGRRIRDALTSGLRPTPEDEAIVERFRLEHAPLVEALGNELSAEFGETIVSARVKTRRSIYDKLVRESRRLSQIQDVAGARVVVRSLGDQAQARDRVVALYEEQVVRVVDRCDNPTRLGYRAIHIVLRRGTRWAEIQLRTLRQNRWAQTVEDLDAEAGTDLKHGQGDPRALQFLHLLSDELRKADLGQPYELPEPPP